MFPTLLSRLVSRLRDGRGNFLKAIRQAEAVSTPFRDRHAFRPRLEVLEDRLTPTAPAPAFSFASQLTFAVGNAPFGVAVGDFNGDGKPDVAASNFGVTSVSVLLNTTPNGATAPSFSAQQTFGIGHSPQAVAVADINGDGKPDIVVVNDQDGTVSVLLNTTPVGATAASFAPQQTFAVGVTPNKIVVADLNADGRPDLIVTNSTSNNASVLMNTTTLGSATVTFSTQQTFNVGTQPVGLAAGDLNGDGRPDIVVVDKNQNRVSVLLNTTPLGAAAASFSATQTFATGADPIDVALTDVNGDGRPDLAVTNYNSNTGTTVSVLLNKTTAGSSAASFAVQQTFTTSIGPYGIVSGDFNGDGKQDLAISNGAGTVSLLENTTAVGATTASYAAPQTFGAVNGSYVIAAADFNDDGRTDLVTASNQNSNVSVLLNNRATMANTITFPVEVGDFTHYGVNLFNRTTNSWTQLTPSDPTVLAANDNGYVVGSFGTYGVNLYTPGPNGFWRPITPSTASALAIDPAGDIVGNFPGYGVFYYRPATGVWTRLTPVVANQVALDAYGNAYGSFTGYGIQEYTLANSTWSALNALTPTTFAVNSLDQVVAYFSGLGVYKYVPWSGWQLLTKGIADSVAIDSYGVVIADFPGYGVDEMTPTAPSWTNLTASQGSLLALDDLGYAYGAFAPYGTYSHQPLASSWTQQTPTTAAMLSLADYPFDLSSPF